MPRATKRALRSPKSPFTTVQTNSDPFQIEEFLDFEELQRKYHPLSGAAKTEINTIVRTYIWQDLAEKHSLQMREFETRIGKVVAKIHALNTAISSSLFGGLESDAVRCYVEAIGSGKDINFTFVDLSVGIQMAEQACSLALTHIKSDSQLLGFKAGRAWKKMVAKLLILAEKFDLPAKIANPTDTSRNLSGFIEFIAGELRRSGGFW